MKLITHCTIILTLLLTSFVAGAQDVDMNGGDISVLKAEKTVNIEFTYIKMAIGDFSKEADYIKKKIEEAILDGKFPFALMD